MGEYFFLNGKFVINGTKIIGIDNRGFRYGEGFFETMLMKDGSVRLFNLHFERIKESLASLKFVLPKNFHPEQFHDQIKKLAGKNKLSDLSRVRMMFSKGAGSLYEFENERPITIIEQSTLEYSRTAFNTNGLVVGTYTNARKVIDQFSHLKTNNFLCYSMAAKYAKANRWNDAILLNSYGGLADTTLANIWIVKQGQVLTPGLDQGAVAGVMRRHLLSFLRQAGVPVLETVLTPEDLANADEVFLTNAVMGVKWVKQVDKWNYSFQLSKWLYEKAIAQLK
jgi:branched-chain amino acid aminotransferase